MTLILEGELASCPLGKFKIYKSGDYCFDDRASGNCLKCLYGSCTEGPNLFDVCKAPDKKTKEELLALIDFYKKTGGNLSHMHFQEFLIKNKHIPK